jgi:hypothetical protein
MAAWISEVALGLGCEVANNIGGPTPVWHRQ